LVGNHLPENIKPYSTAYAGHQFGNWAGQLGDGRAIYAGEIENQLGKKRDTMERSRSNALFKTCRRKSSTQIFC
jgi:uncharacterized protein YdiU (UPF0061 family)